jgi:iron complex outermembrane receptor protein
MAPSERFRVAQVAQEQTSTESSVEKQQDKRTSKKKSDQLEEIIVTGSRIPTAAGQQVVPVRSYTREDIGNSGQTTIGEFLSTLPDVSMFQNGSLQLGFPGTETVQLHGLPVGTTLTLLDGQPLETSTQGFFDLSSIPVAAVERIEILPVGGSAIYGANALAGAVNTILRKNFSGFELNASLDHAPDVNDPGVNLVWGKTWDRGSVSIIGSYESRGALLGSQREPASSTQFPINIANSTVLALGDDVCAPGNVYSLNGTNLPGLSSPEAGIPAGITGTPTVQQFVPAAGKLNVCDSLLRFRDITPESRRTGALFSAHYHVADSTELFTDIMVSHRDLRNQPGAQISADQSYGGIVSANNPYNPFGEAVNVSFAYPGTGAQETQSASLIRPTIGVRGPFFTTWQYEASVTLSQDHLHDFQLSTDFQNIADALSSSNPATALNPFTSGAPGSAQLLNSLYNPALDTLNAAFTNQRLSSQAIFRGPMITLPAGAVQGVVGGEWAEEKQDTVETLGSTSLVQVSLRRMTYAAFGEARVPLLAASEPYSERLALTLAGRYDHSDDFGGKFTSQSGVLWRINDALSLNSSYGLSYEAPELNQVSGSQTTFIGPLFLQDPFRGNQLSDYPVNQVSGPNYKLKPETGNALTLGLSYMSQAIRGLHASLTWYDLNISNYIGTPNPLVILDNPTLFPGAVVRAPSTPQDQQLGYLGVITQFNDTYYNFGDLDVRGLDADLVYALDTPIGQFTPSVAISNIYKWQSAILPGVAPIDAVSQATFIGVGWAPRWKGTAALAWKRGTLSLNVSGRYLGPYRDYRELVANTNEIGNTWIVDATARYEVGQAFGGSHPWLGNAYITLGVVNAFDKLPPFSFSGGWYDFEQYDARGRFLHLNVGVKY